MIVKYSNQDLDEVLKYVDDTALLQDIKQVCGVWSITLTYGAL
jgi:hypothetical protein